MIFLKPLILAAACLASLHVCADTLDDIHAKGVLRVAVPQDSPPFGSVGNTMQLQGYDIDVANLLARELGVKLQLTPVSSANRVPYLQTGKVDLVIASLGKSPEREKTIDFSIPYAIVFSGVFGAANVAVAKPEDLAGKTLGASRGSLEDLEITRLAPPTASIRRFEDAATTMQALLSGQVQLTASTNTVVAATLARNPPVVPVLKFRMKTSPSYIGVGKNEPRMMEKLNAFIVARKHDGQLDGLYQKWFGQALPDMPEQ